MAPNRAPDRRTAPPYRTVVLSRRAKVAVAINAGVAIGAIQMRDPIILGVTTLVSIAFSAITTAKGMKTMTRSSRETVPTKSVTTVRKANRHEACERGSDPPDRRAGHAYRVKGDSNESPEAEAGQHHAITQQEKDQPCPQEGTCSNPLGTDRPVRQQQCLNRTVLECGKPSAHRFGGR